MDKDTAHSILFFIDRMIEARETYDILKEDENERKTSTVLGRRALHYGIILLIFLGGATALTIWALTLKLVWQIILIALAVIVALAMIPYFIIALNFSIKQFRLNKRAIGWISLLLSLLTVIASAVSIVIFIMLAQ